MAKRVAYSRRALPQESKRIPPPRSGQSTPPSPATRKTPSLQGSSLAPANLILPVSRISAPH
jgi:hypothetical protein